MIELIFLDVLTSFFNRTNARNKYNFQSAKDKSDNFGSKRYKRYDEYEKLSEIGLGEEKMEN